MIRDIGLIFGPSCIQTKYTYSLALCVCGLIGNAVLALQ